MNSNIPVGIHATSERALAYRPEHLDEPRAQPCEAGMDDTGDYAIAQAEASPLLLSTPLLLAEVDVGLALRVCRQQTTARDVLLVQALAARLKTATTAQPVNREALDSALWLDLRVPA